MPVSAEVLAYCERAQRTYALRPPPPPEKEPSSALNVAFIVVLLVAGFGGAFVLWPRPDHAPPLASRPRLPAPAPVTPPNGVGLAPAPPPTAPAPPERVWLIDVCLIGETLCIRI